MASPQQALPSTTQQFVTPGNGLITYPWYRLILNLFNRSNAKGRSTSSLPAFITTPVGTLITATAMNSAAILRSGPVADFSDTIDSATNYLKAYNFPSAPSTNNVVFMNLTAFNWTITPVQSVTFMGNLTAGNFVISANSQRTLIIQIDNIERPAIQIFG